MEEMKEVVHNTLKVWRAKKNITQGELANLVGLSRQTINAIETKKYIPFFSMEFRKVYPKRIGCEELSSVIRPMDFIKPMSSSKKFTVVENLIDYLAGE